MIVYFLQTINFGVLLGQSKTLCLYKDSHVNSHLFMQGRSELPCHLTTWILYSGQSLGRHPNNSPKGHHLHKRNSTFLNSNACKG
jgi:hypothetical protein